MTAISEAERTAMNIYDRWNKVNQGCAIAATVSVVAMIVLTGLSLAGYIRPLLPLYILPVPVCCGFIAKVVENYQKEACDKVRPGYYEIMNSSRQKPPEPKKKPKKDTKKDK